MTRGAGRRRAPSIAVVATTAACVFLVILIFLAAQLRAGHDPGLGTTAFPVAAKQSSPAAHGDSGAPLVTRSSGGG